MHTTIFAPRQARPADSSDPRVSIRGAAPPHWWLCSLLAFTLSVSSMAGFPLARGLAQDAKQEATEEASDEAADEFDELREYQAPDGSTVPVTREMARQLSKFKTMLRKVPSGPEDDKLFDDYLRYRLFELTWKENRSSLAEKRDEFKKFLRDAESVQLHNRLNLALLNQLPALCANDRFHPAVRHNAMLMLADLNEREGGFQNESVPLRVAFDELLSAAADEALPDYVRIAAVQGLYRHARAASSPLPPDDRKRLASAMQHLVEMQARPANMTRDGHQWLRMLASFVLRDLAGKGPEANTAQVAAALARMVAEADTRLTIRSEAACTLGYLEASSFANEQAAVAARALADLVVEISKGATAAAAKQGASKPAPKPAADAGAAAAAEPALAAGANGADQGEASGEADGAAGDGAAADDSGAQEDAKPQAAPKTAAAKSRKLSGDELTYNLICAKIGLKGARPTAGLKIAADDATKQFIDELLNKIDDLLKTSGNSKLAPADLAAEMQNKAEQLEQWLKGAALPMGAEPAAPGATVNRQRGGARAAVVSQ